MANPRMTLLDLLNKSEQGADPEFLRDGLKLLAQELMEVEVTQLVGAGLHERAETRLTHRNGYREREWDTRVGTIELDIPKLRAGTYFPSLLEPRRRHERALLSVVQQVWGAFNPFVFSAVHFGGAPVNGSPSAQGSFRARQALPWG